MSKEKSSQLFFLALLPSHNVQQQITQFKLEFAERYQSRHALNSPPHITVFPPFRWPSSRMGEFDCIAEFCHTWAPFSVKLDGFGAFSPRVIYIKPQRSQTLLKFHEHLQDFLNQNLNLYDPMVRKRTYTPHITIAHRDLSAQQFNLAWKEFQQRSLQASFISSELSLLQHNEICWEIAKAWPFKGNP